MMWNRRFRQVRIGYVWDKTRCLIIPREGFGLGTNYTIDRLYTQGSMCSGKKRIFGIVFSLVTAAGVLSHDGGFEQPPVWIVWSEVMHRRCASSVLPLGGLEQHRVAQTEHGAISEAIARLFFQPFLRDFLFRDTPTVFSYISAVNRTAGSNNRGSPQSYSWSRPARSNCESRRAE